MSESQDVPTTPPAPTGGRIFAFYSHTGGTGRSLTLATAAWILAGSGRRVLAVDWSLDAPSLHRYVAPFLRDAELRSTPGVVEMITDLMVDGLSSPDPGSTPDAEATDSTWVRRHALVLNHCVSLDHDFGNGGALDLLPAGRQSPGYNARVATIDWDRFYHRHRGGAFLGLLRDSMLDNYDYVLIDAMNGGAPSAALVTGLLADTVVACARASTGSIVGAAAAARSILTQSGGRAREVLPVLLQIDRTDPDRAEATRRFAERRWNDLVILEPAARIEVPYATELAFEEILPSVADASAAADVLDACERLVAALTSVEPAGSAELDARTRQRLGRLYRRTVPSEVPADLQGETSRAVISYVAHDRLWAEWLKTQLEHSGVPSDLAGDVTAAVDLDDLPQGARVLALLSQPYLASAHAREVWESVLDLEGVAGRRVLVPLRLDYAPLEGPFALRSHLDLAAKDAVSARDEVLTALGRDLPGDDEESLRVLHAPYPGDEVTWTTNLDKRNLDFFGRSDVLEELRNAFERAAADNDEALPVVVLHAADGIGKGEVAHEYAYRFAPDYDVVWRLPGEADADRRGALAALATQLELGPPGHDDRNNIREMVAGMEDRRLLLIFENVESPQPVIELLPGRARATQVIINAQHPADDPAVIDIKIDSFRRQESVEYLRSRQVELPSAAADDVADRVHDLPMALEQAAVVLRSGVDAPRYVRAFTAWLREIPDTDPPDRQRALFASWLVSIDHLRSVDPLSVGLLELCACFGPAPIPDEVLRGVTVMGFLRLPSHERFRLERALDRLHDFSLARLQPGSRTVELHRLLRSTVQDQLSPAERRIREEVVAEALAQADRGDTEDTENWATYERLLPHVRACTLGSDSESVRQLLADSVRAAWRYGSWTVSRRLAEDALRAWGERYGDDDTFVLLMRYHRVNVLWSQGDFHGVRDEATDIHRRFLRTKGEAAEYTLITATILAASEHALGHFGRAHELNHDTLRRLESLTPERNSRRLNAANNLADSERLLGRYALAQKLDEETLQRRRTWFGLEHPWTLQSHASLGFDLRGLGDLKRSAENLELALAGLERVVGTRHEDTIRTRRSLAATRRGLDQMAQAERLISQSAADGDAVFPENHPDLLAILLERAAVLAAVRRHDDARPLARDVADRFLDRFGDDQHPFRLAAEANYVAYLRHGRRRTRTALQMARRVHSDLEAVLGAGHPWVVAARVNLGNYLFDVEEFSEAHTLDEGTYAMAREVLGPEHPDTLVAGLNLATSSGRNRHASATATLSGWVAEVAEQRFSAQHRIVRAVRQRRRLDCDLELPPI